MKSIITALLILCSFNIAHAQWWPKQDWKAKPWGVGPSVNYVLTQKDLEASSPFTVGLEVLCSGAYLSLFGNFDEATNENVYGAGTISSKHPIFGFSGGYSHMFYDNGNIRLSVIPFISYLNISDRYEDKYYGETKYLDSKTTFGIGAGFAYSSKVTTMIFKIATNNITFGLLLNV